LQIYALVHVDKTYFLLWILILKDRIEVGKKKKKKRENERKSGGPSRYGYISIYLEQTINTGLFRPVILILFVLSILPYEFRCNILEIC